MDFGRIDPDMAVRQAGDGLLWYDAANMTIEGKGWADTERLFDRLPARASSVVRPPVWELSRCSAGICARFESDSPSISAKWQLRSNDLAMSHMAATGVSGLDLYVRDGGRWRWIGVGRPETAPQVSWQMVSSLDGRRREYMLYLPLYNGVERVEIGIDPSCGMWRAATRLDKPIVFYGTSVVQGGCASRPGMVHTAILGRRLDRQTINLGFSGNGRMEPEIADLLAELDAAVFVLDALPNMNDQPIVERTVYMVRTIRASRPAAPIIMVGSLPFANADFVEQKREKHNRRKKDYAQAIADLQAQGIGGLHYVSGEDILGTDGEGTVDGIHATDLGFMRFADVLEPVLRPLI